MKYPLLRGLVRLRNFCRFFTNRISFDAATSGRWAEGRLGLLVTVMPGTVLNQDLYSYMDNPPLFTSVGVVVCLFWVRLAVYVAI